jgi:outer membrane protein OmpA-like peptidoglycan-associated protein/tetratricopeptide (TPR) repeat protein
MKLKFLVFFLLATSLAFAQGERDSGGSKKEHKSSLKAAKDHLRYEEFQEAIPYVQELLKEDANSAYYNFWMGKCLYITYKKNQALPYFEKVEKFNPDIDREFYYWYGLTLHYNLYFDRAVDAYRKDLERYEPSSPEYVWVNNRITQCLYAKKLAKKADAEQVKIENMGDKINTEFSEHSPVISANDSVLIYTARRPECLGAKPEIHFYDEDIYVSHKVGGDWETANNIGKPVNAVGHDATISLTADGKTLYIYRHKKAGGLYVTDFDEVEHKWKEPRSVERPLNSKFYEASIAQSADSSLLFFTSDRPGGFGGRDIYMVRKEGKGRWSEPMNLGSMINTAFDEDAPYFHPDGKTLYYSSNGPGSMGGFDIFVTELTGTEVNVWLDPLNMGAPVNTPDDDIYFVLSQDGKSGYYASGMEGGYGEKDIYHIRFPYYPYPRRYHIVEVAGLVRDVQTLDTLQAMVKLVDIETNRVLDSVLTGTDSSKYYFILEPQRTYSLVVTADGYNSTTESLSTPVLADDDVFLEKNMFLDKPMSKVEEVTQAVELQHIYYDFDMDFIRADAAVELDRAIELLAQHPEYKVVLMSHTDWFGTYDYNVDLSNRRAKNAREYLLKKGVAADRILQDHFSENRPLDSNDNDRGRQFNRRTELRIVKGDEVVLTSVRLRKGVADIAVDHTTPKGEAGFDNPSGLAFNSMVDASTGESSTSHEPTKEDVKGTSTDAVVTKEDLKAGDDDPITKADLKNPDPKAELKNDAVVSGDAEAKFYEELNALEFRHIYFDFDKFNLRDLSRKQMDVLAAYLSRHPELTLEIAGHTDAFGSVDYNQALSENRAQSAYNYLQNKGLTNIALMTKGFSELDPMDTNESANGRQNNRRVEFRLMRNGKVVAKSIP